MKYMIMMFGDAAPAMETKSPEWIAEMIGFMTQIDKHLTESGEPVFQRHLADASTAKTVGLTDGVPVATDGPFAEAKESLAGFWVLDVRDEARAIELASRVVVWAERVEVREVPDAPPEL